MTPPAAPDRQEHQKKWRSPARLLRRAARHCLVLLYYLAVVLVEVLGQSLRRLGWLPARRIPQAPFGPGVTVIVPERENSTLLRECLAAAIAAAGRLAEPWEVIVIVNGSAPDAYRGLEVEFPAAQFVYIRDPLGFSQAVEEGLRRARYDWVYLLNNDMVLEPPALEEVLKWRAPHVFAVASQIPRPPARGNGLDRFRGVR
jgi:hypothetical protein